MKKNSNRIIIIVIVIVFAGMLGRYLYTRGNSEYYRNYNRVIAEPDSVPKIDDKF
jgi:hypothetical protein|tara:strand:+ start:86 stop:250 length:165 start_codon:yes stop_codon:yes gene_type:complete